MSTINVTTPTTTRPTTLGVFASIKHVIVRICAMLVKSVDLGDDVLDMGLDLTAAGKSVTSEFREETENNKQRNLAALESPK